MQDSPRSELDDRVCDIVEGIEWPTLEQWTEAKKELGWRKASCCNPTCGQDTSGWSSRTLCALCLGIACGTCQRPSFPASNGSGQAQPASNTVCCRCYAVAAAALLEQRSSSSREVLLLHPNEIELDDVAVDVLSRAFFDDPVERWLFDADNIEVGEFFARLRVWFRVFGGLAHGPRVPTTHAPACALMYDRERTAEDSARDVLGHVPPTLVGATFWCPPNASHGVVATFRAGMARVCFKGGLGATRRLLQLAPLAEINERITEGKPHWYLSCIGIVPDAQSKGYGSQLLKAGLAIADASGEDCYLESSKEKNLSFYEKNGFQVKHRFQPCEDGPAIFCMLRKAGGETADEEASPEEIPVGEEAA